jgi:hypothetical protein
MKVSLTKMGQNGRLNVSLLSPANGGTGRINSVKTRDSEAVDYHAVSKLYDSLSSARDPGVVGDDHYGMTLFP